MCKVYIIYTLTGYFTYFHRSSMLYGYTVTIFTMTLECVITAHSLRIYRDKKNVDNRNS